MMRSIFTFLLFSSLGVVLLGQCHSPCGENYERSRYKPVERLHLQIGGAGTYLYDQANETGFDPDPQRSNGFAEAMLGIRFDFNKRRRRANVLAGWVTGGVSSPEAVAVLLSEQNVSNDLDMNGGYYQYREFEGGFLFKEWFRLSGGVGFQDYQDASGAMQEFSYYKMTTGLSIGITRSIKWNTNVSFLAGEDFEAFTFRPSMGLSFRFNFLKV